MPPKKHPRPVESDQDSFEDEISNTCRGCRKTLASLGYLITHLDKSKTNCKIQYSKEEYQSLGPRNEARKKKRKKDQEATKREENSQRKAQANAEYYQENKEKKSQWYQENKQKIAQKYQ